MPAGSLPLTITFSVPVQMQDLDPKVVAIRVICAVQPVGALAGGWTHHDFGDAGPVVNGAYSGTATVVLTGWATQAVPPGQQWTYQCYAGFEIAHRANVSPMDYEWAKPGTLDWTTLAPSSGPNLVQGTFTTQ